MGTEDPKLLLPEWLRDEPLPEPGPVAGKTATSAIEGSSDAGVTPPAATATVTLETATVEQRGQATVLPQVDSLLDPVTLVLPEDIPGWLIAARAQVLAQAGSVSPTAEPGTLDETTGEEPGDASAVDPVNTPPETTVASPEPTIVVSDGMLVLALLGLLILVAGALWLYLS